MLVVCVVASALPVTAQVGNPRQSDWSRVRNVAPGTEVIVTVRGSQPGTRYVALAGESDLTVLNVADLTLRSEFAARRVLLNVASHHPEYFADAERAGEFVDNDVRVAPDGVFVAGRKVVDLDQVIERLARIVVVEIKTAKTRGAGSPGAVLGALIGYFGGAWAGHMIGRAAGADPSNLGFMFWGGVGGGVAGGLLGYRVASRETDDVIYRAP
jgi:hypothetical protein